jgi:hypothetical protein
VRKFSLSLSHVQQSAQLKDGKVERAKKPAQAAWSVIQTGSATASPCGDSQIIQSPFSRCIFRKTGSFVPNRLHHR